MAADLRGASGLFAPSANTTNAILTDGSIQGLQLNASHPTLVVHNYAAPRTGGGPIPIQIFAGMSMDSNATLQFQLDGNAWGSTISFDAGIPVTLGGNLELGLASGVDPSTLAGDTFQLFDWSNVSPSGSFANIVNDLPAGYSWNTSALYALGDVTLVAVPEPSTFVLLGVGAIGLVGCGLWRCRRLSLGLEVVFVKESVHPR